MMMTMSVLYSTNMFSSVFKSQLTGQHNTDFEPISLCSYYLMSRVQRRSNKYRFNSHWFDPTGDRTTNHYTTDQVHCLIGQSSSTYLKKTDSCVNVMFDHWIQLSIVLPSKSRLVQLRIYTCNTKTCFFLGATCYISRIIYFWSIAQALGSRIFFFQFYQ